MSPPAQAPLTDEQIARRRRIRDALLDQLEAEEAEEERRQQPSSSNGSNTRSSVPPSTVLKPLPYLKKPSPGIPLPIGVSSSLVPDIIEHSAAKPAPITSSNPPREASISKPRSSKSVSFAAEVISKKDDVESLPSPPKASPAESWGDVVPGTLRDAKHESLKALGMEVVERAPPPSSDPAPQKIHDLPQKLNFKPRKVQLRQVEVDSDDEDPVSDSKSDRDSDDEDRGEDGNDGEKEQEEEDDWDEAMLQRELALAYYETQGMLRDLRHSAVAPAPPIISADLGSWEQEVREFLVPSHPLQRGCPS